MAMADQLSKMTTGKAMIIGLAITAGYYLIWYEGGSKLEAQLASTNAQISKDKGELAKVNEALAKMERTQKIKADLGEKLEKVLSYLPEELSSSDLIKLLSTEAKAAGANLLKVSDRSGGKAKSDQFYEEVKVEMELEGSYGQLLLFLSNLTRADKIVTMSNMSMKRSPQKAGAPDMLTFVGTFVGYKYVKPQPPKGKGQRAAK